MNEQPKIGASMVRSGITLYRFAKVNDVVTLHLDHAGGYRLHTGAESRGFRGHARLDFDRWRVNVWNGDGTRLFNRLFKTEAGAARALERVGQQVTV